MELFFELKKVLGLIISPLPVVILLLVLGLLSIRASIRRAKVLLWAGVIVLVLSSQPYLSSALIKPLEHAYPMYQDSLKMVDNIVVLGCYHREDPNRPLLDNLHACSLARMAEALRLAEVYPTATVVLSGYDVTEKNQYSHPDYVKKGLIGLGLTEHRIRVVAGSRDTEQEAVNLAPYLTQKVNLLVTQATHMKRAVGLFNKQGINVVPVPTYYFSVSEPQWNFYGFVPSGTAIETTARWIYELLGNAWQALKDN